MKAFLFLLLLCFLVGSAVAAPCTFAPLSTYTQSGFTCEFGPPSLQFTLKNVTFLSGVIAGSPSLATAADINVTPAAAVGSAFGFDSTLFSVGAGDSAFYSFSYIIDPPPPVIPGFELEMFAGSPVSPGFARIDTDVCPGGFFGGQLGCFNPFNGTIFAPLFVQTLHSGGASCDQCFASVTFDTPVNFISVRNTLFLDASQGGSSQIDGFANTAQVVPEPSAFALGAAGLTVLGLLRRYRRRGC